MDIKIIFSMILIICLFLGCGSRNVTENSTETIYKTDETISVSTIADEAAIVEPILQIDFSDMGIELPSNPTDWQIDYANYLETTFSEYLKDFGAVGVYVEDINNDEIPELFVYTWATLGWEYPQFMINWTENGLVEIPFAIGTSNPGYSALYFVPETKQLIVKIKGHTTGTDGVSYVVYDNTPDGYAESLHILSWNFDDIAYMNGEDISYADFLKIVEQYIESVEMIDFKGRMFLGNDEERAEYLNSMLFEEITTEFLRSSDKTYTYDWQKAFAEFLNGENGEMVYTAFSLYIEDINGDGIPEIMPNNGLYYYNNGVIYGGGGYNKMLPYHYLPETNEVVRFTTGSGAWAYVYSWDNFEVIREFSSWDTDENGNLISVADKFSEIYENLISNAYKYEPLYIDDVGGSWVEYINEKLFY